MDIGWKNVFAWRPRLQGVTLAGCALAALALNCGRKSEPKPTLAAPTGSALASVPSAAHSAAQQAPRPPHPAEQFVFAWSAVLNRRAAAELAPFYGAHVLFYGQRKSAAEVLAAKRLAFEKSPDYQQRVSDLHIDKADHGFVVRFEKRSGPQLESKLTASLRLEATGDHLAIVEESDALTDQRFKQPVATTCGEIVSEVIGASPIIQADIARVAREVPNVNPGGIVYDEQPDRIASSEGYFHEDRYEPRWWIEAASGKLTVRDAYTDELLGITPGQAAVVRRLCTGTAPDAGN